jgi:CheY-like chemotaxis protein
MCHVLIIEDDPIAAADIRATLLQAGASSFDFADSEGAALQAARRTRPTVITADVMLCAGQGPAAVRAIEAELGPTPVIYITASPDQCEKGKAAAVLEKPFGAGELTAAFRAAAHLG